MRRGVVSLLFVVLALATGLQSPAAAQPIAPQDLPPELRPWVPWVLEGVPGLGCPRVQDRSVCVWPGRLRLELGDSGGTFALGVEADRAASVRLPGSAERWPLDVRLDGQAAPVYERNGEPLLRLGAGRHLVSGRFTWSRLPESLPVPATVGLVELTLDGRPVPRPRRESGGLLWLRARDDDAGGEGESLRLQVFRRVEDGIPVFVETRLQLEVSGRAREVTFPQALLPGATVVAVAGDLPARVEDSALRVQVRGGRYAVQVRARIDGRPESLARPAAPSTEGAGPGDASWPEREVWVFAADESLRQVELSGPPAIDPSRTELPSEWATLPAFLLEPGAVLSLETVRRGQPDAAPDAATLFREIWLDPDGDGASVRDTFGGRLNGTTRLDLLDPGALGRVAVDGQDQLVTADPETGRSGVELRRADLQLQADSRLALGGSLPAVGWSTGVEQLQARLNLPPGWSILASRGVDSLIGTWTSRWTLLGFFFVLLVAFGAYRLFGPRHAALAVVTLVLTHGEAGAPFLVWLSLLGAIALRRVAPEGRLGSLGRIWFLVSAAILVFLLVPFARDQVRHALFPQVARDGMEAGYAPGGFVGGIVSDLPAAKVPMAPAPPDEIQTEGRLEEAVTVVSAPQALEDKPARGKSRYAYNVALEQDPKAVVQTGPGVPSWTWQAYSLGWTGPVGQDHRMRLVLASPGLNRVLTALRLLLLGLLAAVLLSGRWPRLPRRRATSAVLGALVLLAAPSARARGGEDAESGDSPGAQAAPDTPRPLCPEVRHHPQRGAPAHPAPPRGERRGPRRRRRDLGGAGAAVELGRLRRAPRRKRGHGDRPPGRRVPPRPPRPRCSPRRGVGAPAPRGQLHPPVRRSPPPRPGPGPRVGCERAADRRPSRGLDSVSPASSRPVRRARWPRIATRPGSR